MYGLTLALLRRVLVMMCGGVGCLFLDHVMGWVAKGIVVGLCVEAIGGCLRVCMRLLRFVQ
jgi:hypothetical protein